MATHELVPYFHPTQVVLVDDDIDFLGNLSLQLDADLAYLLFDSTEKALNYINDRDTRLVPRKRFFRVLESGSDGSGSQHSPVRVGLNTNALADEMYFTNRFSRVSVAMVDYAMPRMDGLTFCKRIRDPYIKKILFTSVATEADAINAFNAGVIDRFVHKSEPRVYDTLNRTIRELQKAHIRDMFQAAGEVFDVTWPALLSDPAVIALMDELKARYDYVEYYLASRPRGFLLVDGDGAVYRLVLSNRDERDVQLDLARRAGAPAECLKALAGGRVVMNPAVLEDSAQIDDMVRQWSRYCQPAAGLPGDGDYVWAVFERSPEQAAGQPSISSYNRYLEWIDTVGYSLM